MKKIKIIFPNILVIEKGDRVSSQNIMFLVRTMCMIQTMPEAQ
jgi:hypothetical protein